MSTATRASVANVAALAVVCLIGVSSCSSGSGHARATAVPRC
ncbi:hypothetical protein AB0F30_27560 [Streptomyces sp. NPDC029006]